MKCKNKIYVICVCLHIVVSNTYCVVFLCFGCLRPVYHVLSGSLDCPVLIAPSVFSTVYLYTLTQIWAMICNPRYLYRLYLRYLQQYYFLTLCQKPLFGSYYFRYFLALCLLSVLACCSITTNVLPNYVYPLGSIVLEFQIVVTHPRFFQ